MSTMRLRRTEERTDVAWAPAAQLPPPCAMLMQALWYRTLNWASVMASGPTRAITGDGFDTGGLVELHAASASAHAAAIATPPLRWNILRPVYRGLPRARLGRCSGR